jgi:hypothetical protein
MALVVNDRVKETSATTGTGTLNLAGAVQDFEGFVAGIGNSNTTYYAIVNTGTGEFEVGLGTVTDASPDTLSRDTIISSSNSDAAVNFTSGSKDVFCTLPASKAVVEDANNDVTLPADLTVGANLDVSSGTIKLDGNYPTGTNNVAMGNNAFNSVTTGQDNTCIGHDAGTAIQDGSDNTFIGESAGAGITSGNTNTAVGGSALKAAAAVSNTVAIGQDAGLIITSGDRNTFVGRTAGSTANGGNNNICLGYNAEPSSASINNEITLGDNQVDSLRIPGLQSSASNGDVLTYNGTKIILSTPSTGATEAFAIKMAVGL